MYIYIRNKTFYCHLCYFLRFRIVYKYKKI